jgi:hypothetical protein
MVRQMDRWVRASALLALVMGVVSCGKAKDNGDAATAAQALLAAVQTGDAKAFEAQLDRPALRADLRGQLQAVARANGLDVAGGAADFALDRMIAPEAFHLVRSQDGAQLTTPPSLAQIAPLMSATGKDRACLHALGAPQQCLLTFRRSRRRRADPSPPEEGWVMPGGQAQGPRPCCCTSPPGWRSRTN